MTLPEEPVLISTPLDPYNDSFIPHRQFRGWNKSLLPVQVFDAGSTEFELSKLLDQDPTILWWQRIYTNGPAAIPRPGKSPYFPDFIMVDEESIQWVVEAKADDSAQDPDVVDKTKAGRAWARAVTDDGDYGQWRYLFATETDIKKAAASWKSLVLATYAD